MTEADREVAGCMQDVGGQHHVETVRGKTLCDRVGFNVEHRGAEELVAAKPSQVLVFDLN